jgi:hypothetical protein
MNFACIFLATIAICAKTSGGIAGGRLPLATINSTLFSLSNSSKQFFQSASVRVGPASQSGIVYYWIHLLQSYSHAYGCLSRPL